MNTRCSLFRFIGIVAIALCCSGLSHFARASAWPVEREWTDEEERAYSAWFQRLATKSWRSTNAMLHSDLNTLLDEEDKGVYYYADCGDLPYIIRAYYAYKRRLPYVANFISGGRYTTRGNTTSSTFDNLSHEGSAQSFFAKLGGVHSGNFRTEPDATDSFTYPVAINRNDLRPGMVLYSPNGHVAMVANIADDGSIKLVDAHPDQSVTHITFGPKLEVRSRTFSGGFRHFRKCVVQDGKAVWIRDNSQLPGYSTEQYEFKDYYGSVRQNLLRMKIDPLIAFEKYIREDTFQEALDRRDSVALGWEKARGQAIPVGGNIYDWTGDWENYSTPSRDLRLRLSMLNIPEQARGYIRMLREDPSQLDTPYNSPRALGEALLAAKEKLFATLTFDYINSEGKPVTLSLNDVEKRLFKLSFDPNHAPELRWGAEGDELKTATRKERRYYADYDKQQYWRNRLEKKQGAMAPDDSDNPRQTPRHDLSAMIREAIEEESGMGG